jgi:hypothetical protein
MGARRVISLVTLLAFLPLATGCSSHKAIPLDSDPDPAADPLEAGKAIAITGYTTHAEGTQSWHGTVQAAPPDSLQFSKKVTSGNASALETSTLTLARADVKSLSVTGTHWGRSVVLATAIIVACGAVLSVWAMASLDFFE